MSTLLRFAPWRHSSLIRLLWVIAVFGWPGPAHGQSFAYEGFWFNNTFSTTGDARAEVNVSGTSVGLSLDLDGPVFGGFDPDPLIMNGTINADQSVTFDPIVGHPTFGDVTASIDSAGGITAQATNIPDADIDSVDISGQIMTDGIEMSYIVHFSSLGGGGTADGIVDLDLVPTGDGGALYDQTDNAAEFAISSQDFNTDDNLDSQAADDFVIPQGEQWQIESVEVVGVGDGDGSLNLFFYADAGGIPGIEEYRALGLSAPGGLNTGLAPTTHRVQLPSPAVLDAGTHWISVQAILAEDSAQWFWLERLVQSNNESAWRNPGGGFTANCTDWAPRASLCGVGTNPDLVFLLNGTALPDSQCSPGPKTLCLGQGDNASRFKVEVSWRKADGETGQATMFPLSDRSGTSAFFNDSNREQLIKVLIACDAPIPEPQWGAWVLFAAATDVEFTLTVTDTQVEISKSYTNQLGHPADAVIDIPAFPASQVCP